VATASGTDAPSTTTKSAGPPTAGFPLVRRRRGVLGEHPAGGAGGHPMSKASASSFVHGGNWGARSRSSWRVSSMSPFAATATRHRGWLSEPPKHSTPARAGSFRGGIGGRPRVPCHDGRRPASAKRSAVRSANVGSAPIQREGPGSPRTRYVSGLAALGGAGRSGRHNWAMPALEAVVPDGIVRRPTGPRRSARPKSAFEMGRRDSPSMRRGFEAAQYGPRPWGGLAELPEWVGRDREERAGCPLRGRRRSGWLRERQKSSRTFQNLVRGLESEAGLSMVDVACAVQALPLATTWRTRVGAVLASGGRPPLARNMRSASMRSAPRLPAA